MFKLVKILNGRQNQPEPIRLPLLAAEEGVTSVCAGCALKLSDGKLANCGATDRPAYICMENCNVLPGEEKTIAVYPVDAQMVFEVPVQGRADFRPTVGVRYALALETYDAEHARAVAIGMTDQTENGVVRVYDGFDLCGDGTKIRVTVA